MATLAGRLFDWGSNRNIGRILVGSADGSTLYAVTGDLNTGSTVLRMHRSTDKGDTWNYVERTITANSGVILTASLVRIGTDIYCVYEQDDETGDELDIGILTYDTTDDTWSAGAGTLPESIHHTASGVASPYVEQRGIVDMLYIDSYLVVLYNNPTDYLDAKYARGDPSIDTSWTADVDLSTSNANAGALTESSVSTRVHVSLLNGAVMMTLDTTDWSLSTEINAQPAESYEIGNFPGEGAYAGSDAGTNKICFGMVYDLGFAGTVYTRVIQEDSNGDLTLTGAVTSTVSSVQTGRGNMMQSCISDRVENPGHIHRLWNTGIDNGIWHSLSTDHGEGSWGTDTNEWASNSSHYAILFTHSMGNGGDRVLAAVVGTLNPAYQEYLVESGAIIESEIRPIADTASAGWESAPTASQDLWAQVDEETPSDTDYIYAEDPNP